MRPTFRTRAVRELDDTITTLFKPFRMHTVRGAFAAALAGEYFGATTFGALAADTEDRVERNFWELACGVEQRTINLLEALFVTRDMVLPDRAPFDGLGRETAAHFLVEPHVAYCEWVAPLIEDAIEDFETLREMCIDVSDVAAASELVTHERVIQSAWRMLPRGFAEASKPLQEYVEQNR